MSQFLVLRNDFPRIALTMEAKAKAVEAQSAARVARDAERRAPRLTGALRASGGTRGGEIVFSARYAGYVEHGTSKMAAEPFLAPALRAEKPKLEAELALLLRRF